MGNCISKLGKEIILLLGIRLNIVPKFALKITAKYYGLTDFLAVGCTCVQSFDCLSGDEKHIIFLHS